MNLHVSPQQAASELLRRRKARASLTEYARYISVPGAPSTEDEDNEDFSPVETKLAEHHVLILEAVQRCIEKHSGRLMIFMPPGSAKSTYCSVVAPSWIMGKIPGYKIIGVSYGSDMARKFGRRTRSIIKQGAYRALFSTALSAESSAADEWALENGSEYMSGGILSGITGNRADCLVAGTLIETSDGPVSIEDLENCPSTCKVLSFNHDRGIMEFEDIEAFASRKVFGIYRVTTAGGSVVEATGNHRFYTERGYVEAHALAPGDRVLRKLLKPEDQASVRLSEMGVEVREGSLLFSRMQPGACISQGSQKVRGLWGEDRKEDEALLRLLPSECEEVEACYNPSDREELPNLQQAIHGTVEREESKRLYSVLLQDLRGHRPFSAHERSREPNVEERRLAAPQSTTLCTSFSCDEAFDRGEGRLYVRDLRGRDKDSCAPHRQLADEQFINQPDNAMPSVPQRSPQGSTWKAEQDYIISVERIGDEARVFDIQVSKNHNFFANGILVHNCVMVDDPIKGRQEADSEVIRQRTIDEYQESVMTRLKPGGSVIIVNTRWHEGDLSGSILPENYNGESGLIMCRDGEEWEVICLAAKCERADDPLGREIGEYIWPEWFDDKHWAKFERLPRTWNALFQQRPAPETGDYFKREWIHTTDYVPPLETLSVYGASDYAVTANGGDYTVHVVVGVDHEGRLWLLDMWRQQASSDRWVDAFCNLVRKWKPIGWAEETGQIKSGVGPFLVKRMLETEAYVAREQFPTRGDKAVRAQSIRGRMANSGLFVHKDAPFLSDLISEMMSFPVGVHDDAVDALGLAGQLMDRMSFGKKPKEAERQLEIGAIYAPPIEKSGRRRYR